MRKLYVKRTSLLELVTNGWPRIDTNKWQYIRCNAKGVINYSKASIYTAEELIIRNNIVIIK